MNKSAKTNFMIILLVVVGAVIVISMLGGKSNLFSASSTNTITVYKTCSQALPLYTNGAGQGQCYVASEGNIDRAMYVSSVTQKTSSSGTVSCTIVPTSDIQAVLTCDFAKGDSGDVEVCRYDSDCTDTSAKCINNLCKSGLSNACSLVNDQQCISSSTYRQCQQNHIWSGNLNCASGTTCYQGQCVSQICTTGQTKCVGTNLYICQDAFTWLNQGNSTQCQTASNDDTDSGFKFNNWIWIVVIVGAVIIILAMSKK